MPLTVEEMTCEQVLLLAATGLPAEFDETSLTLAAWKCDPGRFGLRGRFAEFPDSKRVSVALCHSHGPVRRGLLERTRPNHYRLTDAGRAAVAKLPAGLSVEVA